MFTTWRAFVGNKSHTESGRPPIYLQGKLCITASSTIVRIYQLRFQGKQRPRGEAIPRFKQNFLSTKSTPWSPSSLWDSLQWCWLLRVNCILFLYLQNPPVNVSLQFSCSWFFNKNIFFAMMESSLIGSRNQILSQRWSFATTMVIWKNYTWLQQWTMQLAVDTVLTTGGGEGVIRWSRWSSFKRMQCNGSFTRIQAIDLAEALKENNLDV